MSTKTITISPVKKTVAVGVSQEKAFEVFTAGVDRWWPKEHHIGATPVVKETIEGWKGGKWRTLHEDGSETINGTMLVWDPPNRIVFSWEINGQWKQEANSAFCSEVEVRFTAETANRTRVELEHRNFERMPDVEGAKGMRNGVDNGWPGILELFRKTAEN